jgi:hypothetical protein
MIAVGMIGTAVPPRPDWRTNGDRSWQIDNVSQLRPEYSMGAGEGRLDLRNLRPAESETLRTGLRVGFGRAEVRLPENVDVEVNCVGSGEIECLDQRAEHGPPHEITVKDNGPDGPGGGKILLDVSIGLGNLEVSRC